MENKLPTQIFNGKEFRLYPNNKYFSNGSTRMHIYVWKYYHGEIPKGYHVHHVNENKHDNRIENLKLVEGGLHISEHTKQRWYENPDAFKKFQEAGVLAAAANKDWRSTLEGKALHSKNGAMAYAKAEYKKYICQVCDKEFESRVFHKGPESKLYPKYCHLNCRQRATQRRKRGVSIKDPRNGADQIPS